MLNGCLTLQNVMIKFIHLFLGLKECHIHLISHGLRQCFRQPLIHLQVEAVFLPDLGVIVYKMFSIPPAGKCTVSMAF